MRAQSQRTVQPRFKGGRLCEECFFSTPPLALKPVSFSIRNEFRGGGKNKHQFSITHRQHCYKCNCYCHLFGLCWAPARGLGTVVVGGGTAALGTRFERCGSISGQPELFEFSGRKQRNEAACPCVWPNASRPYISWQHRSSSASRDLDFLFCQPTSADSLLKYQLVITFRHFKALSMRLSATSGVVMQSPQCTRRPIRTRSPCSKPVAATAPAD